MSQRKTYAERLETTQNPLLKKLFKIIIEKRSNLCVAANFATFDELIRFIDKVGKHICVLKTQIGRIPIDSHVAAFKTLYEKKKEHNFLLFEDIKFLDGPDTVGCRYANKYVNYVDLVTVAGICGSEVYEAMEKAVIQANLPDDEPRGCLVVCELSFAGFGSFDSNFALETASDNPRFCVGIIAQKLQVPDDCAMIKASPGVHMTETSDGQAQQWNHPSKVIDNGADVIIVGRGIVSAPESEWLRLTCLYKEAGFASYQKSLEASK